jgi:putative salt-induced outer membrane protein YdiY
MMGRWIIYTVAILLSGWGGLCAKGEDVPVLPLQRLSLSTKTQLPDPTSATNVPEWKSSMGIGFSMTHGNSDTLLLTANWETQKKTGPNEWLLGASGAYAEDNEVATRQSLQGNAQFNHFINSRLYDFGRVDGLHDGIKDIKYRFTASIGIGYYLVQRTNFVFSVEAGPSSVTERQGGEPVQTYAAARLAERIEYKLPTGARLWQRMELIPQVDLMANYVVNAEVGIETAIAKNLALQIYLQDNFVNQPAEGYDHNDIRLISGVSYKF